MLDAELPLDAHAEALVFAASRAQAMAEIVEPALARGETIVADRFVHSSLVYQGAVRGLGVEAVRAINEFATHGRRPDLVVLLDVCLADARARGATDTADRFEGESDAFVERVLAAYREVCAGALVLDGHDDPALIADRIWKAVNGHR